MALVALGACAGVGCEDECADLGSATLELGVGDRSTGYEAVREGERVDLVLGPQGLHMYVMAVRVDGLDTERDALEALDVAAYLGEYLVAGYHGRAKFTTLSDGRTELLGVRVIADVEASEIIGQDLRFVAKVDDNCGRHAETEVTLHSEVAAE